MSSDVALMDPAVEEILRDVASDPNSCLLRIPRPKLFSALARGKLPERADTTGLSAAELELVRTYRCEVAYLLRVACTKLLTELPENALYVSRAAHTDGREVELPTNRAWRRSIRRSLCFDRPRMDESQAFDLLLRCAAEEWQSLPTVTELAAASMRLEPTPQARIYVGIDSILRMEVRTGISMLRHVLERDPGTRISSYAWHNIGLAHSRNGEQSLALAAYSAAAEHDPQPLLAVRCLVAAMRIGDVQTAFRWAAVVDRWPSNHVAISSVVEQMTAQQRALRLTGSRDVPCANRIASEAGPATRTIASVFK